MFPPKIIYAHISYTHVIPNSDEFGQNVAQKKFYMYTKLEGTLSATNIQACYLATRE